MKGIVFTRQAIYINRNSEKSINYRNRQRWTFAAVTSSIIGIFLGLTGLILSILTVFEPIEYSTVNSRIGGLMILSILPIFLFAAHCLDKIDDAERAEKIEQKYNCREQFFSSTKSSNS